MSDYSEAEQYERAKDWIKTNGLWIVAGIAIGALGLAGWRWYQERRITQAETAAARYEEMIEAFARNDRARGQTIVDDLNREYSWTPYAALSTLMAAKFQVEAKPGSPQDFAAFLAAETKKWADVAKAANIKVE